mgnify:CR=1 FL=1
MGTIEYRFLFEGMAPLRFQVPLDRTESSPTSSGPHSDWARLCTHQCPGCTLKATHHAYCPAAVDLEPIVEQFKTVLSYQSVTVEVITPQRNYSKKCDVQTGLRSLIGLIMSTSSCPWYSQLRGLAQSHLPFANMEETLFRVTGAYLMQQYCEARAGRPADLMLKNLEFLYEGLWQANQFFKKRLELASVRDANVNALGGLSMISLGVSFSLQEDLGRIQQQFWGYPIGLPTSESGNPSSSLGPSSREQIPSLQPSPLAA